MGAQDEATASSSTEARFTFGEIQRYLQDGSASSSTEARFTFGEIQRYLQDGSYPRDFAKTDKQALRKRAKFFKVADGHLYYVGGGMSNGSCLYNY